MGEVGGHVILVGLMGSGKSTVGRLVADRLGRPFLDSDDVIESRTGRTVREIFETDGEAAFRAIEAEVLDEALSAVGPAVVAAAGGTVLSADNRHRMAEAGTVVWLRADPTVLVERVTSGSHRPLLDGDPEAVLARMADDRESFYRDVADVAIDVAGLDPGHVATAVVEAVTVAEART